jgi:hypothetical protein
MIGLPSCRAFCCSNWAPECFDLIQVFRRDHALPRINEDATTPVLQPTRLHLAVSLPVVILATVDRAQGRGLHS